MRYELGDWRLAYFILSQPIPVKDYYFLIFCFVLLLSISSILSLFTIYLPDIDECKSDISLCDVNANCSNTYGSYKCTCKEGYNGTGHVCTGMMNLLRFNRYLGLGTGILSVESENFHGCLPILDFLKAFLPKIELSVYPGQRYQILHYFIWFVLVAFSAPRKMSTLSLFYLPSVHLLSGLYRNAKWPFSNFLYCDLSSWSLSPPIKNFSVVGKNICRASAARLFPILLSRKPLPT